MKTKLLSIMLVYIVGLGAGQVAMVQAQILSSPEADNMFLPGAAPSLPIQVPVLVLAYFPPHPDNPAFLDADETGWTDMPIAHMQAATQGMIEAGQNLINEATRYHGYKDPAAPQYLEYYTYDKIEYFQAMPRGYPLGGIERRPHYRQILNNIDICTYVDVHGVKEVWIYGYHASIIVPDESKMSSKYGDVSNAWPKDEYIPAEYRLPRCSNSYVMYNFTYQPGGATAIDNNIHNRLHQIENAIFFAENVGYPPSNDNVIGSLFWDDFSVYGARASLPGYRASCGNTHSPPNTTEGYKYDAPEYQENNCETWHPDDSKTTYVISNCSQWGCTETGFYKWFMQNLPGYENGIVYNGRTMRNWWEAMYDFNAFIDAARSLYEPASFADVSPAHWAWNFIERLYNAGITGGCGMNPLTYCPEGTVTRAQMAVFLERGIHGAAYNPPAVGGSTGFGDVLNTYWAGAWIKQLAADGITGGCGINLYCPEAPVTRAQMAVFLLRSRHGPSYNPPPVGTSTGFSDVPPTDWAAAWIKQLVAEGITSGCGAGTYCPEAPVTRAQMAVFLVRTFDLP